MSETLHTYVVSEDDFKGSPEPVDSEPEAAPKPKRGRPPKSSYKYRILCHMVSGGLRFGEVHDESAFNADTDFDRLISLGAVERV